MVLIMALNIFSITAFAEDSGHTHQDGTLGVLYIPCPEGPGNCKMYMRGWGYLYIVSDGSTTRAFESGYTFQCSQCYTTIVCEKDANGGSLGIYTMFNPGEPTSSNGTTVYATPANVYYNSSIASDLYLSSCEWH